MKLQAEAYDQIILDLGGVILDIDYGASVRAFQSLGFEDFDNQYSQARQSGIFDDLECGRIEPAEFRQWIRSRISVSEEAIDKAWNSMLLGLPPQRMLFLEHLSSKKPLYLLSNTNEIHIQAFERIIEDGVGLNRFLSCFQEVFYSSRIGKRKPNTSTFQWVMESNRMTPSRTLFIDDSIQHVKGAQEAGLVSHLLKPGEVLEELFL